MPSLRHGTRPPDGPKAPQTGARELSRLNRVVQIDPGEDAEDADHYISPEERLRIAMSIQ